MFLPFEQRKLRQQAKKLTSSREQERIAQFWANSHRALNGCLLWGGSLDKDGYGKTMFNGKYYRVPRLALELKLGRPLGEGMEACHTCDNPPCFEPEHLFEGTKQQNMADAKAKGRKYNKSANKGG